MKMECSVGLLIIICAMFTMAGCAGYYSAYPGYGPYYGPGPYYGNGPYYGGVGSVSIAVGDRPYYTHGPGYYVGHSYYRWRPGHWSYYHGHRSWLHGHYVVRGY